MKIAHSAPKLSTCYSQVMHRVINNLLERFFHQSAPRSGGFFGAMGEWASRLPSWLLLLVFVFVLMLLRSVGKKPDRREPTSAPNEALRAEGTEQGPQAGPADE